MNPTLNHIRYQVTQDGDQGPIRGIMIDLGGLRELTGNQKTLVPQRLIELDAFASFMIQGLETTPSTNTLVDVIEAATLINNEYGITSEVGREMLSLQSIVADIIRSRQYEPDLKLDFTQQGDLFRITLAV